VSVCWSQNLKLWIGHIFSMRRWDKCSTGTPCTKTSCTRTPNLLAIRDEDLSSRTHPTPEITTRHRGNLQYTSKFNVGWESGPGKTHARNNLTDNGSFWTDKLPKGSAGLLRLVYWLALNRGSSREFPALLEWFWGKGGCQMCPDTPDSSADTKLTQH
jgi:hypothetical protein